LRRYVKAKPTSRNIKVNPSLVLRDENGEIYTVRNDAATAMLLNEFLKET
jgi:hypothetical protein